MLLSARLAHSVWNTIRCGSNASTMPRDADLLREKDRVRAEVGADFDHDVARLHDLAKQLDFALGVLAVQIERAADVHVVDVVQHLAVTAGFLPVEGCESGQADSPRRDVAS